MSETKELIIGFILFGLLIWIAMSQRGPIEPNLETDGGYDGGGSIGHPLWTD